MIDKLINTEVLILVVVEDVLVHIRHTAMSARQIGLNPCCSGRCSSTIIAMYLELEEFAS